jgi:hypothetical protein
MSLFSTYDSLVSSKIANNSEVFFDADMKRQAANDVTKEILQEYDIPEMVKVATLTIASGIATIPTDYFRMVKLWSIDSSSIQEQEYQYVIPDSMDSMATTASYYWTEDYDTSSAVRVLKIRPTSVTSLQIRYVIKPTEMTSGSVNNGLSAQWDECIAYGCAMKLFQNSSRWDESREFERLFKKKTAEVYSSIKNPGGFKQSNRVRSRFERISLLNNNNTDLCYNRY